MAPKSLSVAITLFLFAVALFFAYLLKHETGDKGSLAYCLLGTAVLIAFSSFIPQIDNLRIGPTGVELTKKVEEAKAKADDASGKADDALNMLTRFILNSMPKPTFDNLVKIGHGNFGVFRAGDGFRQQLRYLRDSGCILVPGTVGAIPSNGPDLSQYVSITPLGREFVQRRLRTAAEDAYLAASNQQV